MKYILILTTMICNFSNADVHDRYIVDGKIRSEYEVGKGTGTDNLGLWYANNGLYGDEGCLFDATANSFGCPGRRGPASMWQGTIQHREACGGDPTPVGDSWQGCLTYPGSPYFSIGVPDKDYWVIHANHDPSFDQCREGPPSLSHPIANHATEPEKLFNVSSTPISGQNKKEINIKINASEIDPYCDGDLAPEIPFLSVGSHFGAGNQNYIATISSGNKHRPKLKFKMRMKNYVPFSCDEPGCPSSNPSGAHAGFFVIAEWSNPANPGDPSINYPKFVWVDLLGTGIISGAPNTNSTAYWNWPIYDSMFWPGGEIAFIGANIVSQCSGLSVLPLYLNFFSSYDIDLVELFRCASDTHNRFQTPMPTTSINVIGVHFFTEIAHATNGEIEISVRDVRID